jgi:small GTP-binding protein
MNAAGEAWQPSTDRGHARTPPPATDGAEGAFAVLTSPGPAAIAAVQVCGPRTPEFAAKHLRSASGRVLDNLKPGRVVRARLCEGPGSVLDDVLVAIHAGAPACELRLFLHGSPWLLRSCCELLSAAGFARQDSSPAPLWPARDAIEAEAHALLPQMQTLLGARWLLSQADRLRKAVRGLRESEDWENGRARCLGLASRVFVFDWFSRPARVALIGPPNAGKSTLANALAEQEVSLTSAQPGTTRDWVEIPAVVRGFPVVWLDTAGLRHGAHDLEAAAADKTRRCIQTADAAVLVLDGTAEAFPDLRAIGEGSAAVAPAVVVLNKFDHADFRPGLRDLLPSCWRDKALAISASQRINLGQMEEAVLRGLGRSHEYADIPGAFTKRQADGLKCASEAVESACYRTFLGSCLSG